MSVSGEKSSKLFYGWWIVVAGFFISAASLGLVTNCFGVLIKPICADLGFSRQALGGVQTIFTLMMALFSLISGAIFRRVDLLRLLRVSGVVLSIGYFSFSLLNDNIFLFYLVAFVVGFSSSAVGVISFSTILCNWFEARRGFAIGVSFMGSGFAGMVFSPLINAMLAWGWRPTMQVIALLIAVFTLPFVFFVVKIHPEDKGLRALGLAQGESAASPSAALSGPGFAQVRHNTAFWLICVAALLHGIAAASMIQLPVPHLTDVGYASGMASLVLSLCMAAMAVGKFFLGVLYDKLGMLPGTMFACISTLLGVGAMVMVALVPSSMIWLAVGILVLCFLFGSSFSTVGLPIVARGLFGSRDYSIIFGLIAGFSNFGCALAPTINGAIYDRLGSYNPGFYVWMALMLVALLLFYRAIRALTACRETRPR